LLSENKRDIAESMLRATSSICALFAFAALSAPAFAQEIAASPSPAAGSSNEDVRVLRQLIEQQSRQIETLTQQVSKLNQLLESTHSVASSSAATPASTQNMPPVQESVAAASPASSPGIEPPKAIAANSPAASGPTHVVAKGETLTSIAKHYNVSVADLLKVNKIEDARKLQIGQTLMIPPNAKPPEPSHP